MPARFYELYIRIIKNLCCVILESISNISNYIFKPESKKSMGDMTTEGEFGKI
jgi:hypothetical protein